MSADATAPALVIGVGNRFAGDDGVGPAVVDRVHALAADVPTLVTDGESARLVEAWSGAATVVLVDAVRADGPPGTVHVIAVDGGDALEDPALASRTSSHAAGVAEAWALGSALGRVPRRLVVIGVEGRDFAPGPGLSAAVAAAVPAAAAAAIEAARQPEGTTHVPQ